MNKPLFRLFIGTGFLAAGLFLYKGLSEKNSKSKAEPVLSVTALYKKIKGDADEKNNCTVKGFYARLSEEGGRPVLFLQDDPDSMQALLPLKCFFQKETEGQLPGIELYSELVLSGRAVHKGGDLWIEEARIISQNSPQPETK